MLRLLVQIGMRGHDDGRRICSGNMCSVWQAPLAPFTLDSVAHDSPVRRNVSIAMQELLVSVCSSLRGCQCLYTTAALVHRLCRW